ncbi:HAMP domain-containing protein [Nocardioides carbamazepini]|uniref:adenylate/guanylate cyclase domain-containing protein n=1 Tax=Nocardioides carbamazepini TaxID=2854259 RepID=UPI00214A3891|nr:adenylate/guanylate cyclase domain-containing protein [Nocardioides carbamazepini]MCR1783963.1 HAMP domain-containing protein [Nocardioides carbamazepini]
MSIQTKVLAMMLLSSILAAAVVGFFAYRTGTSSLEDEAYERLTELRIERARQVSDYLEDLKNTVVVDSKGYGVDALLAFDAAYEQLRDVTVTPAQQAEVRDYYEGVFVPQLQETSHGVVQPESFIPTSPARTYLQAEYTAVSDDWDERIAVDDAGDGSAWSAAHARWHPLLRDLVVGYDLDDLMLLNDEGDVVWTAYKGVDLGSNIKRGEYRGGGLEEVFDAAMRSNSVDFTAVSDLELYQPSYNAAAGFVSSPIVDAQDELIGVLVAQVPIEVLDGLMNPRDEAGDVLGLGETGETYLVGPDGLLRSNSRTLIEDADRYAERARENGLPQDEVDHAVSVDSAVMIQTASPDVRSILATGKEGTRVMSTYLGYDALTSYGPVEIEGLDWVVVATMDEDEAFEPVDRFARNVLIAMAAVALLVCVAAVLAARLFTAPLDRLLAGVRKVAGGELGTQVTPSSRDEFGDLAMAFNDMSASLLTKQELLEAQQAENERMLLAQMPEPVARRYRSGETAISGEHPNVTVVYTEIEGFDEFAGDRRAEDALDLLNSLARGFDDAARQAGIEKVRSLGTGYIAACGLVVERVDHARRVVDFATDVATMITRFNAQHGARLALRAGIHSGPVRSGLVGAGDVVYNLWGEAVGLAYRIRSIAGEPGIYLTDAVRERLGNGAPALEESGSVDVAGRSTQIWRLTPTKD